MSEFENNGVVGLCATSPILSGGVHVINSRPNCALIGPGGGFYRRARQSCDDV